MRCNGWKEARLGDFIEIKHGYAFEGSQFSDEQIGRPIIVNIGNFDYSGGFRFDSTRVRECTGDYPSEYALKPGDILLAMTCQTSGGEILGIPGRIPDDGRVYLHNQRLGKVVIKNPIKIVPDFIYYLCLWSKFRHELFVTATGTKILHTAPKRIENFRCTFPPPSEQKIIADILASLDNKIEINNRINATLEEMTLALFKSWFNFMNPIKNNEDIEFEGTPADCGIIEIGSIVKFIKGKKPLIVSEQEKQRMLKYLTIDTLSGLKTSYAFDQKPIIAEQDDILMVMDGASSGSVFFGVEGIVASTLAKISVDDKYKEYTYWLFKSMENDIKSHTTGSAIPHTDKKYILFKKIVIPDNKTLLQFSSLSKAIRRKIVSNRNINARLMTLRNTLLPKLMSGEIRVPINIL